jgi:hypothetical protein
MESSLDVEKSWRTLRIRQIQPKIDKQIEIFTLYPGYDILVNETISRYCPFNLPIQTELPSCNFLLSGLLNWTWIPRNYNLTYFF